jgi:hypothetical protein
LHPNFIKGINEIFRSCESVVVEIIGGGGLQIVRPRETFIVNCMDCEFDGDKIRDWNPFLARSKRNVVQCVRFLHPVCPSAQFGKLLYGF